MNIKSLLRANHILLLTFSVIWCFSLFACRTHNTSHREPMPPKRELRAVWITTVDNKDFPTKAGLSTWSQQQEIKYLLDKCQQFGINAVFFQVRPSADAFYASNYEPWSAWITGKQGQAPQPFYDPLAFIIEECHARNMELHAWFNPYRARYSIYKNNLTEDHISNQKPEWFITYNKRMQFDPGLPEVRAYLNNVVMDVAKRYDIDGIHFDDYFYPYRSGNQDFPDDSAFALYAGDYTDKAKWRRDNINQLIKGVHDSLQAYKPWVKFGISPLGVWRNKAQDTRGSDTDVGQTAYDQLGADALKWLSEGWIDYIAPQLYWSMQHPRASYEVLANWWNQNHHYRHLYIGQAFFKIQNDADSSWSTAEELLQQMRLNRQLENVQGSVFFRVNFLLSNPDQAFSKIKKEFYQYPCLLPTMPWKDQIPPLRPKRLRALQQKNRVLLNWQAPKTASDGDKPYRYVVYRFLANEKIDLQQAKNILAICQNTAYQDFLDEQAAKLDFVYVVTAIDRLHNESPPISLKVK